MFYFFSVATFLMPQSRGVVLFSGLVLVVLVVVGVSQVKVESDGTLSSTLSSPFRSTPLFVCFSSKSAGSAMETRTQGNLMDWLTDWLSVGLCPSLSQTVFCSPPPLSLSRAHTPHAAPSVSSEVATPSCKLNDWGSPVMMLL